MNTSEKKRKVLRICQRCRLVNHIKKNLGKTCDELFEFNLNHVYDVKDPDRSPENLVYRRNRFGEKYASYEYEVTAPCYCYTEQALKNEQDKSCTCLFEKEVKKWWITINPPDNGYTINSFIEKIRRMITKMGNIKSCWYCFEFGKIDTKRKNLGIHCHIWVVDGDARRFKYLIKRNFEKEYKNCKKCLDFALRKEDYIDEKLAYCRGLTFDEQKDIQKANDVKLRKKYGIDPIYTKNFVIFD